MTFRSFQGLAGSLAVTLVFAGCGSDAAPPQPLNLMANVKDTEKSFLEEALKKAGVVGSIVDAKMYQGQWLVTVAPPTPEIKPGEEGKAGTSFTAPKNYKVDPTSGAVKDAFAN